MSKGWFHKQSKNWLETILLERLGVKMQLIPASLGWLRIAIDGSEQYIEVALNQEHFTNSHSDLPCPYWDCRADGFSTPTGMPLPAPGAPSLPPSIIEKTRHGYRIHYDFLGFCYWMLSRTEEVGRRDLDEHDRFPAKHSHALHHGYLERPVVDEWLEVFKHVAQRVWPQMTFKSHQFKICLSHDVDLPSRYGFLNPLGIGRAMIGDVVRHGDIWSALKAPYIAMTSSKSLSPHDPCNTFNWMMDVSEARGLKSAFYFICGRTDKKNDAAYDPSHLAIRKLMREIHHRGHEIGLHPSYNTYCEPELLTQEAKTLMQIAEQEGIRQECWGGRMHVLRWAHPNTIYGWLAADMDYDATLGYADHTGFRAGTAFDYPAFDPVKGKILAVRLKPLVVMECTVIAPRYMGLGNGIAAFDKITQLKNTTRSVGGNFTLLWHNSHYRSRNERELYRAVIDH